MSPDDGQSIWVGDGERFFLVPDDLDLLPGPMTVTNLLGRKRLVDPAAIASFEVSREAVNERVRGKANDFVESLRTAMREATGPVRDGTAGLGRDMGAAGTKLEAELKTQLDAFKSEMQNLAANFKKTLQDMVSELAPAVTATVPPAQEEEPASATATETAPPDERAEPAAEATPEAEAPAVETKAEPATPTAGAVLVESLRAIPRQLEAALSSPEVEQLLRDAATKLQQLADRLRDRNEAPPADAEPASTPTPDPDPPSA